MKCEPDAYTIDDLARDGQTSWEGVRNYQARNLLRDEMQVGDGVLFYASNADPSGVTGLAQVSRAGYPDASAWKKASDYYDEKSTRSAPIWFMVDIAFVERFADGRLARDAEGHQGPREHDGHQEGQPALGATGDQGRVRHRCEGGSPDGVSQPEGRVVRRPVDGVPSHGAPFNSCGSRPIGLP